MKVCAKCGWQNEDEESKCFQCYADLTNEPVKKVSSPKRTKATPEAEPSPEDDSANVWNDPDMRPVVHDTVDYQAPQEPSDVRMIEEEVIEDEDEVISSETESTGLWIPLWAVMVAVLGFVLIIALIGHSFARGPEGTSEKAVSRFMDAVVARDFNATKSALSGSSQQLAGMAPLMLGTVGAALVQGADLTYTIDHEEKVDNEITIVWCSVKATRVAYGSDSGVIEDTVPVFAKVEKGRWIADLKMTAMRQASHKMKSGHVMVVPPQVD